MRRRRVLTAVILGSFLVYLLVPYSSAQESQEEHAEKTSETAAPAKAPPKAKSGEEFEAYQKFMQAQDPDERIRGVEDSRTSYCSILNRN